MTDEDLAKIGNLIDQKNQPINKKLDSIVEELASVHKKVDVTYDFVKFQKEKNDEEFDEIRQHIGMQPKNRESLKFSN
jgi:hypothetical protein